MTTPSYQAPPLTESTLGHAVTVFRFDDGWSWARIPGLQAKALHEFAPSFVDEHPLDPTPRKLTSNPFAKHSLRKLWFVLVDPMDRIRALFSLFAGDGERDESAIAMWFGHNFALSDATIPSLEMLRRMVTLWLDVVQPRGAEDLQGTSFSAGSGNSVPILFPDEWVERAAQHDAMMGQVPTTSSEIEQICIGVFDPAIPTRASTDEIHVLGVGPLHKVQINFRQSYSDPEVFFVRSALWPESWGWRPVRTFSEALRQLAPRDSHENLHLNAFVPRSTYLDLVEELRMPGTVPFDVSMFDLLEVPSPLACQDDVFFPWIMTVAQGSR